MKKTGLVILGMIVLLIGIISLSKKENKVLVEEEINNSNTYLVFMLQDKEGNYNKSEELPSNGYSFNTSKSVCSNNTTPTWEDNKLYLNNLSKNGTSCYLYFDRMGAKDLILSNSKVNEGTPDFSETATTDEGIYKAEDDWGESYYFRGAVENNWLKFAGYYWRIIRINGDGSIRVIYNGTSTEATGDSTMINNGAGRSFNDDYDRSEYVGYMYTEGEQHGNTTNSDIKTVVDNWYNSNLKSQENKISKEAGFCGDREIASGYSWSSTDTYHEYAAYERLQTNKTPSLKCSNSLDLYTTSESSKGNHALSNPVGLVTADEISIAGGAYDTNNTSYYLYNGAYYWTMTPTTFYGNAAGGFSINLNGSANNTAVSWSDGDIRPVINIASDVKITGSGTSSDPYVVEGAE